MGVRLGVTVAVGGGVMVAVGGGVAVAAAVGLGERVDVGGSVAAAQAVKISKAVRLDIRFMWCSLCVPDWLRISMPRLGGGVNLIFYFDKVSN